MRIKLSGNILDDYPEGWPPKQYFVNQHHVTQPQLESFRALIERCAGEKEIGQFLGENLPVMASCLTFASTGHHGTWIITEQVVRPPQGGVQHGLKPDYIIGGKSSDGFDWYVLELKGANESIFSESEGRVYFSNVANRGVFQLLEYIDYCSRAQSYLRETLCLTEFREPRGLLLIGREDEIEKSPRRERIKAAWNRGTRGTLEVRTYDALLRFVEREAYFRERVSGTFNNTVQRTKARRV